MQILVKFPKWSNLTYLFEKKILYDEDEVTDLYTELCNYWEMNIRAKSLLTYWCLRLPHRVNLGSTDHTPPPPLPFGGELDFLSQKREMDIKFNLLLLLR